MLKISENAQLTEIIFEAYISVLKKYLQEQEIELPILLLVNGQKIPFTLEMGDFCRMQGIILYASYLNSPNLFQPVQGDCIFCIKQSWNEIVSTRYMHKTLKKSEFLNLIQEVFETLAPGTIRKTFRSNGIYPWRATLVDAEASSSNGSKRSKY
jgi:hypothetical protein